ncbi:MliC family protein [uncultured Cohaesibacter sp.]|uniref:MliC family protein n=1 Tax=uncultured Cohaesibacter sp. TaxID=1002546 RepID=UPI0029C99D87|nr:MliC family protein [uncultured Cohaesibacter sp.]
MKKRFTLAAGFILAFQASTVLASPDVDFPQYGQSYGGKVRAGPSMNDAQIGSLYEGMAIQILNGTGVIMNGYEWFRIQYGNGNIGYHWGGLFCSERYYPTIYTTCDRGLGDVSPPIDQQPRFGAPQVSTAPPSAPPPLPDPTPEPTSPMPVGVDGYSVSQVFHSAGSFSDAGGGNWEELNDQGRVSFRFVERGRNDTSVFLYDASRSVSIQLDLQSGQILYAEGDGPKRQIYTITNAIADVEPNQPQQPQEPSGNMVQYTCDEGIPLSVSYHNEGEGYAVFTIDGSPERRLEQVRSGSGTRYTDGIYSLHSKGNSAILESPTGSDRCSSF